MFRVWRIDKNNEFATFYGILDDGFQTVRQDVETVVEEIELKYMGWQKIGAIVDAFEHDIDV